MRKIVLGALFLGAALVTARQADAFCGFYVGGADAKLFNNATMVVLMREGLRTVLSMQNNYQGPPENFAMVVPVPIVLQKENVKTLPRDVFDHIDTLAAPRLVEYWEQDPCPSPREEERDRMFESGGRPMPAPAAPGARADLGVRVEAEFTVGEYDVVVLSAEDSSGLDTWLRQNKYKIPEGAEPILRPYVAQGMRFFVAKVDTKKVRFENGQAMLSPLRFHYDSDNFSLPVRLGLLNSAGTQDLIVHILSRGKRYEVQNYRNVTIPTNFDVGENAKERFGEFYAALFDRTVEENPGAVVTEYSWDAGSCDPCPTPALDQKDIMTLGGDALIAAPAGRPSPPVNAFGFTLTRLHARYGKSSLGQDLIFREAGAIEGGREEFGAKEQPHGAKPSNTNNFQGRYIIRHPWTGPIACEHPRRGVWGGPPPGVNTDSRPKAARDTAFAPRGKLELASFVREAVPELKIAAPSELPKVSGHGGPAGSIAPRSCGACATGGGEGALLPCSLAALLALALRKRRQRREEP